jgi:A/G-specific adenine glycosylase
VFATQVPRATPAPKGARWVRCGNLPGEALPNVMRKVLAHAFEVETPPSFRAAAKGRAVPE